MCLSVYCNILHYVFVIYVEYCCYELLSWDRRVPLKHIDRRVLLSYGLEWLMSCVWYFEELTKLCAYRCYSAS